MKATPIRPTGIARGHVGPLYPASGNPTTHNNGTKSRDDFIDRGVHGMSNESLYNYATTKADHL